MRADIENYIKMCILSDIEYIRTHYDHVFEYLQRDFVIHEWFDTEELLNEEVDHDEIVFDYIHNNKRFNFQLSVDDFINTYYDREQQNL